MKNRQPKNAPVELPAQPVRRPRRRILSTSAAALVGVSLLLGTAGSSFAVGGSATWLAAPTNGNWETVVPAATNWSTGAGNYPGTNQTTFTSPDVGTFNVVSSFTLIAINAPAGPATPLNISGITFGGLAVPISNYTVGAVASQPIALTSGGTITLAGGPTPFTSSAAVETVNAPLYFASANTATYTFSNFSANGAGAGAGTLNLGGPIASGSSGITGGDGSVALTLDGTNTNANTIGGAIGNGGSAGTSSITKNGTGVWILAGANTYTGTTTVNNGTLRAGFATNVGNTAGAFGVNSAVTLNSLGGPATVLDLNGFSNTIGSLNTTNTNTNVTNGGAAATLTTGTLNTTDSYIGTFSGALGLTKTGTGLFTVGGTAANTYTGLTTVDVANGAGGILRLTNTSAAGGGGTFGALGAFGTAANGTLVQGGAALQLALGGVNVGGEFLTLNGTGVGGNGALENFSGTNTWAGPVTLGSASTIGVDAGTAVLASKLTLGTSGTLLAGGGFALTLNAGGVTGPTLGIGVLNANLDNTLLSLTKTGTGTWQLGGNNTGFTGPITISAGVLQAGSTTAFGPTAPSASGPTVTLAFLAAGGPATLDLNGMNNTVGGLYTSGAGAVAPVVDNTAVAGAILTVGSVGAIATPGAGTDTFSGIIQNTGGALSLIKVGAGTTLALTGPNTYSGTTAVTQGILVVGNASALGAADGSATTGTTVTAGAQLTLNAGIAVANERLALSGTGVASGGALHINAGAATSWAGPIVLNGAPGSVTTFVAGAGATVTFTGGIDKSKQTLVFVGGAPGAGGGTFNVGAVSGQPGISSPTDGGTFTSDMVFNGGTTNLVTQSTYTGTTWVTNGVILNANVVGALPAPPADGGTGTVRTALEFDSPVTPGAVGTSTNGSTLNVNANQAVQWIDGTNAATAGTSTITFGGAAGTGHFLTFGSSAPVATPGGGTPNFAGVISQGAATAGTGGIIKDGNNTQILSGANTYTGTTTVVNGKLQAGIATVAFGVGSNTTVGNGSTLGSPNVAPTLELAGFSETIGSLSGTVANAFVQNNFGAAGTSATLTLGSGGGSGAYAGVIQDAPAAGAVGAGLLNIVKTGAGTETFGTGVSTGNTYTGTTAVTGGILQAGQSINAGTGAGAFGINSAVTITAPGTLDANGKTNTIGNLSGTGTLNNSTGAGILTINTEAKNAAGALAATQTQFTGLVTNTGGSLALVINDGFGAGTGVQSFTNNGSTYSGGTTVNTGATLDIDSNATGTAAAGALGTGTLIISAGANIGTSLPVLPVGAGVPGNSAIANNVTVNGSFNVTNVTPLGGAGPGVVNGPYTPFGAFGLNSSGVQFIGPGAVTLAGALPATYTINTSSGYLDFLGAIGETGGSKSLAFVGHTFSNIAGAVGNTYTGLTTLGDLTGGPSGTNYLLLGKTVAGAFAIPGNFVINSNGYAQFDPGGGAVSNQINPTANVLVNGTLDTSGLNQAVNALTGTGVVRLDSSAYNFNTGFTALGGGTLTVNSGVFGGNITGAAGQLVKNSIGTFILTAANTYTGNTTINAGILQVDGSTKSANTFVNPGATLQGVGFIGGNVINSGTVKPGDSPGTLSVGGNYTQNPNGNLRIELASTSSYGRLQVTGKASLNGTLTAVSVNGFQPKNGNVFTVLTAGGGVNGTFATFNDQSGAQNATLRKFTIVYDPNDVKLEFTQGSFVQSLRNLPCGPMTPNEFAVAQNLDRNLNNGRLASVITYLDNLPTLCTIKDALDLIAPEEVASIYNTEVALANVQTFNLQRRTADLRAGASGFSASGFHMAGSGPNYSGFLGGGSAGPDGPDGKDMKENKQVLPEEQRVGVFLTGDGEWVNVGDDSNARGYDLNSGGFTLGVDYKVTSTFAIGLDAGYAHTNGDLNNGGRLDVDGGKLGVYATYFPGDFYIDTAVNGGLDSYSVKRAGLGGTTFGDTDGGDLNVLFGTGYMFHSGGLTVGPTGTFQYTYMGIKHFTEHGSVAPLDFPGQDEDSLRTAVGGKASYDWKTGGVIIRPEVSVAWQHEFADTAYAIDSQFANAGSGIFRVNGPNIGRDSVLVGAGAAILWNERFSTYVYYDGEFGRTNYDNSNVSGGLRLAF